MAPFVLVFSGWDGLDVQKHKNIKEVTRRSIDTRPAIVKVAMLHIQSAQCHLAGMMPPYHMASLMPTQVGIIPPLHRDGRLCYLMR